jgi:4-carboxymuconolactone decarboxylase
MEKSAFDKGMALRREVLGDAHVDASWQRAQQNELTQTLQELVTELAWGSIWSRPGLDRRTRSTATVAALIALNRPHELAVHLRGALNNGLSREELKELLIHCSAYCGWPAVIDAFRVAEQLFATLDEDKKG